MKHSFYSFLAAVIIPAVTGCNNPDIVSHGVLCAKIPSRSSLTAANHEGKSGNNVSDSGMTWIPGGQFTMGSEEFADARPLHGVTVNGFWMDSHEVTNAQFAEFVKATGYITVAERELNPADFPGVPVDKLVPGSAVFTPPSTPVSLDNPMQWWTYVPGASWKHPKGPSSSIEGKENDPVVQVCFEDAAAYAKWAGKRLPTEAEWEYAARANNKSGSYYWGSSLKPEGKWAANIFQGKFPSDNLQEDGYKELAPVKSFAPNANGLYDMEGNVWEWCSDLYRPDYYSRSSLKNPTGPTSSYDPQEPNVVKHVQRGGSFLCSDEYCNRYKQEAVGKAKPAAPVIILDLGA